MADKDKINVIEIAEKLAELYACLIPELRKILAEKWSKGHVEGRTWKTTIKDTKGKKMEIIITDAPSKISLEVSLGKKNGIEYEFSHESGLIYQELREICNALRKRSATT